MRAVIQRVSEARVTIAGREKCAIGQGIVVLLGIEVEDTTEDLQWLAGKISRLRIFDDNNGIMNLSAGDVAAEVIVVSQFTLHASTKKGNRPSYIKAARPEQAIPLYEQFIETLGNELGQTVNTGEFGAMMQIALVNDGPVTILIDSRQKE